MIASTGLLLSLIVSISTIHSCLSFTSIPAPLSRGLLSGHHHIGIGRTTAIQSSLWDQVVDQWNNGAYQNQLYPRNFPAGKKFLPAGNRKFTRGGIKIKRQLQASVMMLYIVLSWCYIGQCLFNSLINWCHVTYTLLWTINLFTQQASSSLGASSPLDLSTSGDKYLFSLITTSLFFYMKGSLLETLHQLSGILNAIYYDNDWKLW